MEEGCDAMNMIDKLNQEFDVIMEKNIQLEKEKLELYKEIHKLQFKMIFNMDRWMGMSYFHNDDDGFDGFYDEGWSIDLQDAVEYGLEKNIILKNIYGFPSDYGENERGLGSDWIYMNMSPPEIDENGCDEYGNQITLIDNFQGGVYH